MRAVSSLLDSDALPIAVDAAVAAVAVLFGWRELGRGAGPTDRWPTCWFVTAALFAVLAIGRLGDLGHLLGDLGRHTARDEGWYDTRRSYQAAVVAGLGACWAVAVVLAVWRVPERRRRYLPAAVVTLTVVCYVAVQMVSLHQIDALLDRRHVGGVEVGRVIELGLLGLAMAVLLWSGLGGGRWRRPGSAGVERPDVPVDVRAEALAGGSELVGRRP